MLYRNESCKPQSDFLSVFRVIAADSAAPLHEDAIKTKQVLDAYLGDEYGNQNEYLTTLSEFIEKLDGHLLPYKWFYNKQEKQIVREIVDTKAGLKSVPSSDLLKEHLSRFSALYEKPQLEGDQSLSKQNLFKPKDSLPSEVKRRVDELNQELAVGEAKNRIYHKMHLIHDPEFTKKKAAYRSQSIFRSAKKF